MACWTQRPHARGKHHLAIYAHEDSVLDVWCQLDCNPISTSPNSVFTERSLVISKGLTRKKVWMRHGLKKHALVVIAILQSSFLCLNLVGIVMFFNACMIEYRYSKHEAILFCYR